MTLGEFIEKYKEPVAVSELDSWEGLHYVRPIFERLDDEHKLMVAALLCETQKLYRELNRRVDTDGLAWGTLTLTALSFSLSAQKKKRQNLSDDEIIPREPSAYRMGIKIYEISKETSSLN